MDVGCDLMQPRSKWSTLQETALIEMVLNRETLLFGELKGTGAKKIGQKKGEAWEEITHSLNAQFPEEKRDVEKVRKKFFNLRQRAKAKIDDIKKSMKKTGGGPALPPLTESENLLADAMDGRPLMHGIDGGIDTDEPNEQQGEEVPTKQSDVMMIEKVPSIPVTAVSKESKKKRANPEFENMQEDTKRIKLEQRKLELEIEILEVKKKDQMYKREAYDAKRLYYLMKMQSEFGVEISGVTFQSKEQ